jgi:hypothetical protein
VKKVEEPEARRESFVGAEFVGAEVLPDPTTQTKTKLMKIVSITRTPGGRIARVDFNLKAGPIELEIDEPTARAIVKVFDDDSAKKPPNVLDMQDELGKS